MALMYRLENPREETFGPGKGVFGLGVYKCMRLQEQYEDRHPTAYEEGVPVDRHHYFGFRSLAQLDNWFPVQRRSVLADACGNLWVGVYEAPDHAVRYGQYQMMMDWRHARRVDSMDPVNLDGKDRTNQPVINLPSYKVALARCAFEALYGAGRLVPRSFIKEWSQANVQ